MLQSPFMINYVFIGMEWYVIVSVHTLCTYCMWWSYLLCEQHRLHSFISMAVMENNLSVPIYSADGLWLGCSIYLLQWEFPSERELKLETAYRPAPQVSITHLSWTERERGGRASEGDRAMRAVQLLLMQSPEADTDTALYKPVPPEEYKGRQLLRF